MKKLAIVLMVLTLVALQTFALDRYEPAAGSTNPFFGPSFPHPQPGLRDWTLVSGPIMTTDLSPSGLAFDGTNFIAPQYGAGSYTPLILFINPNTGATVNQLPAPYLWPMNTCWTGTEFYMNDYKTGTSAGPKLFKIDPGTGAVLDFWPVPYSYYWGGLTFDGTYLWQGVNCNPNILVPCHLYKIEIVNHTVVDSLVIPTSYVDGVAWYNDHFFYSDHIRGELYMMTMTGVLVDSTPAPGTYPSGMCMQEDLVCLIDHSNHAIYKYNPPMPIPPLNVDVTVTPVGSTVIPAQGGSLNFTCDIVNNGPTRSSFAVWARIHNPNGSWTLPTLGPVTITPLVGFHVNRARTQTIPATWAAGAYQYVLYAGAAYPIPIADSSYFNWTKSATADGGPAVWEAVCSGELFEGETPVSLPAVMTLSGAYPNPFNPTTIISFTLPQAGQMTLAVFDVSGRQVASLVNGYRASGTQQVTFDGSRLASGLYLVRLTSGANTVASKIMLLK